MPKKLLKRKKINERKNGAFGFGLKIKLKPSPPPTLR
jgi:hypothetical protein